MYWTDCSSFCRVGVATPWQKGPKENSLEAQCYKQHYIQVLFIYLFFLECWIVNWHAGQRLRSTSKKKKNSTVNSWKTTKQNELSSAFPRQFWDLKKRDVCGLPASRPLNNLKYTEHLTEMRQRWLTDTSISPAICLTEGGERLRVPHAWRREHCLLVRGDREREGGWGWGWRGEREIASSQFQFDEGHSVSSGWAEIYVTLASLRLQKRTVKMWRDLKSAARAILQGYIPL